MSWVPPAPDIDNWIVEPWSGGMSEPETLPGGSLKPSLALKGSSEEFPSLGKRTGDCATPTAVEQLPLHSSNN